MKTQWNLLKAGQAVGAFRRRLREADFSWSDDSAVDLHLLCRLYLSCEIVLLEGLTDRAALRYLQGRYGIDGDGESPDDTPLAGGLYLARRGLPRWIFIERRDSVERQRFTLAHEIGHLILEAEAESTRRLNVSGELFAQAASERITRFSRCAHGVVELRDDEDGRPVGRHSRQTGGATSPRPAWTAADLREFDANHFAAELLMPLTGVQQIIARETGPAGVRRDRELEHLVSVLSTTYQVSHAAARKRLCKDLSMVPSESSGNLDLFG